MDVQDKNALNAFSDKILTIIRASNQLRFDMDAVSVGVDLTKVANIQKVYEKLEQGVKLFEDFYKIQLEMEKVIDAGRTKYIDANLSVKPFYDAMQQLHKTSRAILTQLRQKETEHLSEFANAQSSAISNYKQQKAEKLTTNPAILSKIKSSFSNSISSAEEMNKGSRTVLQNDVIPAKYKLYGRFYYFYNVELISKNNKYGSGLVFEMNSIIQQAVLPVVKFTEIPHIFQVIYPRK